MFIAACSTSPTTSSTATGRAAAGRGAARRRRPLPGRRRRQGHRDVLRHRQRDRGRVRVLARRRLRLRRLGRLRPQGDGHHRPRRLGVGQAPLPRARHGHPDTEEFTVVGIGDMSGDVFGNGMLLSRHTKLVAAFDHRHIFLDPDPDPAGQLRRAAAAVRRCPARRGRTTTGADLGRRRGLAAQRQVDPGHPAGAPRARPRPTASC